MTTTTLHLTDCRKPLETLGPRLRRSATAAFHTLALWHHRHVQRRDLAALTPDLLADIGVGEADAAAEARKPFWRA